MHATGIDAPTITSAGRIDLTRNTVRYCRTEFSPTLNYSPGTGGVLTVVTATSAVKDDLAREIYNRLKRVIQGFGGRPHSDLNERCPVPPNRRWNRPLPDVVEHTLRIQAAALDQFEFPYRRVLDRRGPETPTLATRFASRDDVRQCRRYYGKILVTNAAVTPGNDGRMDGSLLDSDSDYT